MGKIVENYNGEERVGTFLIANGFDRRHNTVTKHIGDYKDLFCSMEKSFTRTTVKDIPTRKVKSKGRPIEEYLLNEAQTIFLGTLFRTSSKKLDDPVLLFKAKLAKEFVALKDQNLALQKHQQQPEYQITREAGKIIRRQATDTIKDFISYANNQGSKNGKFYYSNFTKMVNGLLLIVNGRYKNLRAVMSVHQLMATTAAEQTVVIGIKRGMKQNKFYKEIYKDVKTDVEIFAESHGQLEVIDSQLRLEA